MTCSLSICLVAMAWGLSRMGPLRFPLGSGDTIAWRIRPSCPDLIRASRAGSERGGDGEAAEDDAVAGLAVELLGAVGGRAVDAEIVGPEHRNAGREIADQGF